MRLHTLPYFTFGIIVSVWFVDRNVVSIERILLPMFNEILTLRLYSGIQIPNYQAIKSVYS